MQMYRHITVFAVGFVSLVLQTVLLRELLSASSGNELDIGITLGIWLLAVGTGSLLGERISHKQAFGISFLVVSALSVPVLWSVPHLLLYIGEGTGQALSLGSTFILTVYVLTPICIVLGAQFPLAVAMFAEEDGEDASVSLVYGLEALGAFAGGMVFSFILSGRVGPGWIVLALSLLSAIAGAALIGKRSAMAMAVVPLAAFAGMHLTTPASWMGSEVLERVQSRYAEILVTGSQGQYNFFSSGKPVFSYPDQETVERAVHLPMAVHPRPFKVLVVGGSPAQLSQYLMYSVDGVDYVQMDPHLLRLSIEVLDARDSSATQDRRVRMIVEDARAYLKSLSTPMYDMIVVSPSGLDTASGNRFYTTEFFREAASALREGGVLALSVPASPGYVSRRMRLVGGAVFGSLGEVFKYTEVSTDEYGLLLASDVPVDTEPGLLAKRFRGRGLSLQYFRPYLLQDAFAPERTAAYRARLEGVDDRNSDMRPLAYMYNLMLWVEMQDARMLGSVLGLGTKAATAVALLFLLLGAAVFRREAKVPYYAVSVAGFSAMGFMVVVMLGFQAMRGFVYEMFGLLSALFMVGIALGAVSARRVRRAGYRAVLAIDVLTALLAAGSVFFITQPSAIYLISLLAGLLTGGKFAAVSLAMELRRGVQPGGRLYAMELAGSFLGALVFSVVIVPVSGLAGALILIAVLNLFSASAVWSVQNA